jgi:hypothetical protein
MRRLADDAGARSAPVRGVATLHVTAGALIVAGVSVHILVSTKRLMTPVDVSGTLFGGAMGSPMDAAGWTVGMGGVLLVALLRLPGFRLGWIATGGVPIVIGALALWHYPTDYGGNQIFSLQRSEIVFMMVLGGAFLALGAILHRYVSVPKLSNRRFGLLAKTFRLLAMAGMAVLFIALPIVLQIKKHQAPLPPCAHNSMGRQLTVCL